MSETSFSYSEFNTLVREVGDYLAELRYLDLALAYIGSRHQHPSGSGGPRWDYLRIPLGTTQPFTRDLGFFARTREEVEAEVHADLASMAEEASTWAAANITSIREIVRPIVSRSMEAHDDLIDALDQDVRRRLNMVEGDFGKLSNNLSDWKGDSAEKFADDFYTPFMNECLDHQADFVGYLQVSAVAARADLRFSQVSLMNVLAAARDSLQEQLTHRSNNIAKMSAKDFLAVGAVVVSAAALVFPGSLPAAATALAISSGLGLASAILPDDPETKRKIIGTSAVDLEDSLGKEIVNINEYYNKANVDLYGQLRKIKSEMDELYDERLLTPARPAIADGVSGDKFYNRSK